jgi:hypothetical protein
VQHWKCTVPKPPATRESGYYGNNAVSEARKLAAILVSDIVGYSRLTSADEDRTLAPGQSLRRRKREDDQCSETADIASSAPQWQNRPSLGGNNAQAVLPPVGPSAVSLVGSYKLVSSTRKVLDTGEVSDTFGTQPGGYIIYTSNGRMLVLIVSDKNARPTLESGVAPTDEQAAKLFRTMQAYGGTYEFDGHAVKHHIDMSWNQTWTGTTQVRDLQKDGDKLIYTTRPYPFPADGKMSVVTVVWQKVD